LYHKKRNRFPDEKHKRLFLNQQQFKAGLLCIADISGFTRLNPHMQHDKR
jgi:hypothetical protein